MHVSKGKEKHKTYQNQIRGSPRPIGRDTSPEGNNFMNDACRLAVSPALIDCVTQTRKKDLFCRALSPNTQRLLTNVRETTSLTPVVRL